MVDAIFEHPRLAAIDDALDPDRRDLDPYVEMAEQVSARRVLDVGCGTGCFALLLADRGIEVSAVDPAGGSLAVARAKPGSERVRWLHGDATALPPMQVDLVTMTANVAQAIAEPGTWRRRCGGCATPCDPGRTWPSRPGTRRVRLEEWDRDASRRVVELPTSAG